MDAQGKPVDPAAQQPVQQSERRKDNRLPVLVALDVVVGGVKSQIFYPASIQNFSDGGICIDWEHCEECSGYSETEIHPFCIFGQFSAKKEGSKELTIRVDVAGLEQKIEFKGKVVYTSKKKNKEYVGIVFTNITPEAREQLDQVCKSLL